MFINAQITKCSFCSGLQVFRWYGKRVLMMTLHFRMILKCHPDRVFIQGMGVVHYLAEVDNEVRLMQSQYCYARRSHLTPMPLVLKSLNGNQKCDSGSLHCFRYTGELTNYLCWAWLAGYCKHAQGLLQ